MFNLNLVCFNWISTASFITLDKNVFQLHYWQYKIGTAPVCSPLFFSLVESAILKKIKVVSIEHLKQKLSLDNN